MTARVRRRGVRLIAATATLTLTGGLVACGDDSADTGNADDCAAPEAAQAEADDFPRTIEHDKGETELEEPPATIVALEPSLVEAVLALDATPVGGVSGYEGEDGDFPSYLGDETACIEDVGPMESPDLETIAALEPYLIVSASVRHEDIYNELDEIAPTVFVETTGPTWKDNISAVGEAIGAQQTAETKIADYEKRAKAIGDAINETEDDPEMSVLRFLDGPARLMGNDSFTGILFTDMGLQRPSEQDVDDFAVEISEEQIRKADGDHVFVSSYTSDGAEAEQRFTRNPLWRKLDAVQNDNVHDVDDDTWMLSVSLQGADIVLDDMAEIFDVDPATED